MVKSIPIINSITSLLLLISPDFVKIQNCIADCNPWVCRWIQAIPTFCPDWKKESWIQIQSMWLQMKWGHEELFHQFPRTYQVLHNKTPPNAFKLHFKSLIWLKSKKIFLQQFIIWHFLQIVGIWIRNPFFMKSSGFQQQNIHQSQKIYIHRFMSETIYDE